MIPEFTPLSEIRRLPPRPRDAHKGLSGRVAIIAGSRGMSGAAILSGLGALRGGAGLVRVYCPNSVLPIVAGAEPCLMTRGLAEDGEGRLTDQSLTHILEELSEWDVLAIGPGLGRSLAVQRLVRGIYRGFAGPLVLDADGLNAMAGCARKEWVSSHEAPRVLTPHPGEMERLALHGVASVADARTEAAHAAAKTARAVVVLKGSETIVADGTRLYRNESGNPGMAVGGTGDVLTGLLSALLAGNAHVPVESRLSVFEIASLAVNIHGRAGDLCADRIGPVGYLARELADAIPSALTKIA